jgi:hypothetical protein
MIFLLIVGTAAPSFLLTTRGTPGLPCRIVIALLMAWPGLARLSARRTGRGGWHPGVPPRARHGRLTRLSWGESATLHKRDINVFGEL